VYVAARAGRGGGTAYDDARDAVVSWMRDYLDAERGARKPRRSENLKKENT